MESCDLRQSFLERHLLYIILACVLLTVLIILVIVLLLLRRQRWRQENEVLGPVSFTNPNYSRSSCDAISIGTRVRPWRLFKFDRNEERVSMLPPSGSMQQEEKLNNQETASLLKQKETSEGAVAMAAPRTHHHGNNLYKESNIKTASKMEEAKLHYKPVDNDL